MVKWLSMLLAFALLGCSAADAGSASANPQPQANDANDQTIIISEHPVPDVHPQSGLKLIPVTIFTETEEIGFLSELADTPEAQARGLMFRTELNDFAGMLFPSQRPQIRSFWMKNTPLPLDIIFIGPDMRILNIAANTTPYSLDSVRSDGLAIAVFEIAGGRAEQLGITAGDRVEYILPE